MFLKIISPGQTESIVSKATEKLYTLDNGLKVIFSKNENFRNAGIVVSVNYGSRYDLPEQAGAAHFIEHMLFQGTDSRTSYRLAESIEKYGGKFNASTTQERTYYEVLIPQKNIPVALDVLADMYINSKFSAKEMEIERAVILEEKEQDQDDPEIYLMDMLDEFIWKDQPLGRSILGNESSLQISAENLLAIKNKFYTPQNTLITVVGNFNEQEILVKINSLFGNLPKTEPLKYDDKPVFNPGINFIPRQTENVYLALAIKAFGKSDKRGYVALLLAEILAGGAFSSRLMRVLRDKHGLVYSIDAQWQSYTDSGIFVINTNSSPSKIKEILKYIRNELLEISEKGVYKNELERAVEQLRMSFYEAYDNPLARAEQILELYSIKNELFPLTDFINNLEKVTGEEIQSLVKELFIPNNLHLLFVGQLPKETIQEIKELFNLN